MKNEKMNNITGELSAKVSELVEKGVKEKGFSKQKCLKELNLKTDEELRTFEDAFYNTLETTDEYQVLVANLDSDAYKVNPLLIMNLNIDVILRLTEEFNLSISEVDQMLKEGKIIFYLHDVEYLRIRVHELSSEAIERLLYLETSKLSKKTILENILEIDNAVVIENMVARVLK